jgi:hypothetical protein
MCLKGALLRKKEDETGFSYLEEGMSVLNQFFGGPTPSREGSSSLGSGRERPRLVHEINHALMSRRCICVRGRDNERAAYYENTRRTIQVSLGKKIR